MGRTAGVTAADTRRRLLEAAAAEFDRQGFEGTRVTDIASGACVSNGALYGHFGSKTELLAAALQERAAAELDGLFRRDSDRSLADLLRSIGRALLSVPPGRSALMVEALVAARRDREVATVASNHLSERQDWLAGLIREGQTEGTISADLCPEALARFCIMLVLGSLLLVPAELPEVPRPGWKDLIDRIAVAMGPDSR